MGFGMTELVIILLIVLFLFGPKRIKSIGSELGSAIKGFRTAVTEEEQSKTQDTEAKVIDEQSEEAKTTSKSEEHKV